MTPARIVAAALAALGAAVLLLPSSISTATSCDASDTCLTEQSLQSPSLTALVGSGVFAVVVYVFMARRLHMQAVSNR